MYNSYGALELKMTYQKNMVKAMTIVLLTSITIVGIFITKGLLAIEKKLPIDKDKRQSFPQISPTPTIIYDRSEIGVSRPRQSDCRFAIPTPVGDDQFELEEESVIISSNIELFSIGLDGSEDFNNISNNLDYSGQYGDFDLSPDSFQSVEIYPEIIYEHKSPYPKFAKIAGLEGVVWIKALVGREGDVIKAIVAKTSEIILLDEAALEDALLYKYRPGIQNGVPVKVWVTYKVEYRLR